MKPSEVLLNRSVLPLCGSAFGRAELEFAAAIVVLACVPGDEWQPVAPRQIGEALRAAIEPGGLFAHLAKNPFVPRPDFPGLVTKGFARWVEPEKDLASPLAFTDAGLAALEKFRAQPRQTDEPPPPDAGGEG